MSVQTRAVVLGGAGFIGSHVADVLSDRGHRVAVFDLQESPYLRPDQEMIVGDVTDASQVCAALDGARLVYNFAGIADINEAAQDPVGTVRVNILGNVHALEAVKNTDIDRYVLASTLYVYSGAGSFYRDSKVACELYVQDYHAEYGVPFTVLRFGSIYGPRTNRKDRIYRFLRQAISEGRLEYPGDGEEIREYIHVEDAARCTVEILDQDFLNQHVIITGHQPMKIKDLVVMIDEILGKKVAIEFTGRETDMHYEVTPYSFTPRLGRKYLSSSYIDLGEGIMQAAESVMNETRGAGSVG